MLDVSVKTLDGTNRSFSLPDDITVKDFKERISESISISADRQRLIFQGRVLQDEKKLAEYNVSGKVIHVVERPPPDMRRPAPQTGAERPRRTGHSGAHGGLSIGAFSLPDLVDPNHIQNLVQQTLSGMGDLGRNARVTSHTSSDGSAVDVHINLTRNGAVVASESQQRINLARRLLAHVKHTLGHLEHPVPTEEAVEPTSTAPVDPALASPISIPAFGADLPDLASVLSGATLNSPTLISSSGQNTDSTSSPGGQSSSAPGGQSTIEPGGQSSSAPGGQSTVEPKGQSTSAPGGQSTSAPGQSTSAPGGQSNSAPGSQSTSAPGGQSTSAPGGQSTSAPGGQSTSAPGGQTTQSPSPDPASRNEDHPETKELSDLLDELRDVERRLEPFRQEYHRLMTDDPVLDEPTARTDSQRFFNYVSSCLHHLGHVYHHISDLMVDFTAPRPRRLRAACNPPPVPTAVIHQTIPVQAQVSLISTAPLRSNGARARSRHSANASRSASNQNTQQAASSGPTSGSGSDTASATMAADSARRTTTSSSTAEVTTTTTTTTSAASGQLPTGAFGAFPASAFAPITSQPYMFMEVGPNAVSVNSISTHVVREGEDMPSLDSMPGFFMGHGGSMSFTAPTGAGQAHPPPDFMSNLMRMAQQASQRMPGPRGVNPMGPPPPPPPPANGNLAPPTSGTTTPRSGTSTPPTSDASPRIGVMPPIIQMDNRSVDPFMICSSRHYLPMRQHPQRQNGEAAVNEVVNSLIGALVSGGGSGSFTHTTSTSGTSTMAASGSATTTSSATAAPTSQSATDNPFAALFNSSFAGDVPNSGNFAESLRHLLSQTPAQGVLSSGDAPAETGGEPQMTDEMFMEMVTGITSNLGQMMAGQPQHTTLLDFLNSMDPSHQIAIGEGILNDFYLAISRRLTFPDLIQLFAGRSAPLQALRSPLQQFIREEILLGREPTEENVDMAIDRLLEEENFSGTIEDICRQASVTSEEGIDFPATLVTFEAHQLRTMINIVMNSEGPDPEFAQRLYDQCRSALHELVVLSRRCLRNGMEDVDRLLRNRVGSASLSVANPMIRHWLVNTSSQNLRSLTPQITVTDRDVQHYISHKSVQPSEEMDVDSPQMPPAATGNVRSPVTATSPPAAPPDTTVNVAVAVAADTRSDSDESFESFEDTMSTMDTNDDTIVGRCAPVSMDTRTPLSVPNGVAPTTPMSDWRRIVPPDWIPIITRDAERQEQQPSRQDPFSDAYVSGMPAKRRKVMLPENSLVAPSQRNVPAIVGHSIGEAMRATGIRPLTSIDSVQRDLAAETESLTCAYQQQVLDDIQRRLRADPDYCSKRFPNTKKYFEGEK